jgi:hypothetical protein
MKTSPAQAVQPRGDVGGNGRVGGDLDYPGLFVLGEASDFLTRPDADKTG